MEIGGLPPSSVYAPPQVQGVRARKPVVQETARKDAEPLSIARDPRSNKQDTAKPAELQIDKNVRATPADSIQIGIEDDGARVMKVHDMKEYLIYQVPAKGELMLVQADERAAARQVQTSA